MDLWRLGGTSTFQVTAVLCRIDFVSGRWWCVASTKARLFFACGVVLAKASRSVGTPQLSTPMPLKRAQTSAPSFASCSLSWWFRSILPEGGNDPAYAARGSRSSAVGDSGGCCRCDGSETWSDP